jgi:hypothetical protein
MTAAAVEVHRSAMLGNLQAVAVQLGFVQPVVAGGHALGCYGAARLYELDEHVYGLERPFKVFSQPILGVQRTADSPGTNNRK